MKPLLFALPGSGPLGAQLARTFDCDIGDLEVHRFPDGESYVRLHAGAAGRDVVFAAQLDRPDDKLLGLYFAAATAQELGARRVGLVLPYLPYMRQDARFKPGEAITSVHFARLLSGCCDWMVTVDPHLHRHHSLSEIYAIRTSVIHAAPDMARWIGANVAAPFIVGPDAESEQWVRHVAALAGCPYTVFEKVRRGDRDVEVSLRESSDWQDRTPVLVDDIVSTARTMVEAAKRVIELGLPPPVCVGVHALFAGDAYDALRAAGVERIVTCNTVPHDSNAIDVMPALGKAIADMLA
ncbi:ribose-phosphate pyrophosphokinase [Oxalobacteraceae bacterium OM1]|nr:ribose-phosphate pyrophosphokinase [Oxalobacteraceae bacterium OM1]